MIRRLFSILSLISLLLWLLALMGWIRSQSGMDRISGSFLGYFIDLTVGHELNLIIAEGGAEPMKSRWMRFRYGEAPAASFWLLTFTTGKSPLPVIMPSLGFTRYPKTSAAYWDPRELIPGISAIALQASTRPGENVTVVKLTSWLALLSSLAILPICWVGMAWRRHRRRVHRLRNHLCLACGYDLRASTDKCPECGTAFSSSPGDGKGTSASSVVS